MKNYICTDMMHPVIVPACFVYYLNFKKTTNLLWNLGLESFDLGACVGQQLKHFLLLHKSKDINRKTFTWGINNIWAKCLNISTQNERLVLPAHTKKSAATNLYRHSKVVAIFNSRYLELHPHWHLPEKSKFIHPDGNVAFKTGLNTLKRRKFLK